MTTIEELSKTFNTTLMDYIKNMAKLFPDSTLSNNLDLLQGLIDRNQYKFIDQFVLYVLAYKDKIDNNDEDFLLNHDFKEELKGKSSIVEYIFEAKNIWGSLNKNQQDGTFLTLQVLCYLSQQYVLAKYDN
jgi:hypothetical protein